jgi:hypothetical protein
MTADPNGGWLVPDCNGGRIKAPVWLTHVPFWAALCVHAPAQKDLTVDVGTSLIAHDGLNDASSAREHQVYYALKQITVPKGDKKVIFAVCGGAGDWLWSGTRVVPGHRLPAASVKRLSEQVSALEAIGTDMEAFRGMRVGASTQSAREIEIRLQRLDGALTDAAGLLRDALIQENRSILTANGRAPGQLHP